MTTPPPLTERERRDAWLADRRSDVQQIGQSRGVPFQERYAAAVFTARLHCRANGLTIEGEPNA